MRVALMVPCYIDMFYPRAGVGGKTVHPAQGTTTLSVILCPRLTLTGDPTA